MAEDKDSRQKPSGKKHGGGMLSGFLHRSQSSDAQVKSAQDMLAGIIRSSNACGHLLGAVSDAVISADENLGITGWNRAAEEMYGWSAGEVMGKKLSDVLVIRLPDGSPWESVLQGITETGEWRGEVIQKKRGGGRLEVFSSLEVMENKNGDIALISVNRDLTARRQAEKNARWSEEQFRTLADSIPQLVWIADERGEISWCNRRWVEYTGITLDETHDNGWQKAHHPDYLPKVMERIVKAFREGKAWEDVFPLKGKNGQYRMFFTRSVPFSDSKGKAARWMGTSTDINEIREAQQALRESEKRFRCLADNTCDAYMLFENILNIVGTISDLRCAEVNHSFEIITGSLREEALGKKLSEIFPTDAEILLRKISPVAPTGETQRFGWHSKSLGKDFTGMAFPARTGYTAFVFHEAIDDIEDIE